MLCMLLHAVDAMPWCGCYGHGPPGELQLRPRVSCWRVCIDRGIHRLRTCQCAVCRGAVYLRQLLQNRCSIYLMSGWLDVWLIMSIGSWR